MTKSREPGQPLPIFQDRGSARNSSPSAKLTTWTLVARAGDVDQGAAREALDVLARRYFYPVFARVRAEPWCQEYARKCGCEPSEIAVDATQRLFLSLVDGAKLRTADRQKGSFEGWIKTCGSRQLYKELRSEHSGIRKRQERLDLRESDGVERRFLDEPDDLSPEELSMRAFSLELFQQAFVQLRERQSNLERHRHIERYLLEQTPRSIEAYQPIAEALAVTTRTVASLVSRLRRELKSVVRDLVLETIDVEPACFESELRAELIRHANRLSHTPYHLCATMIVTTMSEATGSRPDVC